MHKQTSVNKMYDPACGSGSLLLQAKKHFDAHIIEEGFFGQEINHTTYNLARMNMQAFDSKANVDHFAKLVPFEKVAANDYNLSVSSYVEAKDNREVVDIAQLNAELKTTVSRIDQLRKDIDAIVAEIEA